MMGVFGRFFAKKMGALQAREFAAAERAKRVDALGRLQARLDAVKSGALLRLDCEDKTSLPALVRGRIVSQPVGSLTRESIASLAQMVRDGLELCAHAPLSGGVRQVLLGFEPIIGEALELLDEIDTFERVLLGLESLKALKEEQEMYQAAVRALEEELARRHAHCELLKREKERFLSSPDVARLKSQLESVGAERKWVQGQVRAVFEPVLPLFARTEHPLLSAYVDDPVKALVSDFSLSVIKEAQLLAANLRKDGLIDTVALSQAGRLQQGVLAPLVHRYAQARRQEERLLRELESLPEAKEVARLGRDLREAERVRDEVLKKKEGLVGPNENALRSALAESLRGLGIVLV